MSNTPGASGSNQGDATPVLELARENYKQAREYHSNGQLSVADNYYLQARKYYGELGDWSMAVKCAIYRSQVNYELVRLDSLDNILREAQAVIDRESLKEENFKQERIFFFRGLYYEMTGQYQLASDILEQAQSILKVIKDPIALDSAYLSSHKALSGSIYYDRRDFGMAVNHYQTALAIHPHSRPDPDKLVNIYNNLGLALIEQGQYQEGMNYLKKSFHILPKLDPEKEYDDFLQTYFNLSRGHLQLEELDEAAQYLDQARHILDSHPKDQHIWYSLSAQMQEKNKQLPEALALYQSALQERTQIHKASHPSIAKLHLSIGKIAEQLGKTNDALDAFQRGLQVFDKTLSSSDFFSVPVLREVNDYFLLIQLLTHRGDLLKKQYPARENSLLPTFRTAIQAIDSLRLLYESDASKLLLSKEAKAVFASGIELLYQRYQKTKDPVLLEEAFEYMEKSKALLLLENIKKWRNIRLQNSLQQESSNLFIRLLEQEKNAKLDLILLQRSIEDARESSGNSIQANLNYLERELQKVSRRYQQVKTMLSDSFPQYYEASYENEVASISRIQQGLLADQPTSLIAYFIFNDQSFAMLIRKDTAIFKQLPPAEKWQDNFFTYQKALRAQRDNLLQPPTYQSYVGAATKLYDQILRSLLTPLDFDHQRLYLVPDDLLGFLAFESLLVTPPASADLSYSLSLQDYLVEHFALSYGYSATLLLESLDKKEGPDNRADYGGFAPVFQEGSAGSAVSRDCTTGSLMYLPYSEKSVRETHEILGGETFLNEHASLVNFKQAAGKFRILQLATHACVDQRDALFNVIYFSDTSLATYEIFDIPLQADLIILSACETGSGDLLEGEGIMSLSRGFYYAGSPNVVTSLWPADDHATQKLMVRFNRYLKDGLPKDQALRRAKLDYLNSPDLRPMNAAPAFWANFILIGNQKAMDLDSQGWAVWQWLLAGLFGLLLIVMGYLLSARKEGSRIFTDFGISRILPLWQQG